MCEHRSPSKSTEPRRARASGTVSLLCCGLSVLLAGSGCQGPLARSTGRQVGQGSRIAVVDLGRVFSQSLQREKEERELGGKVDAARAEVLGQQDELLALRKRRDALNEADPEREELDQQIATGLEALQKTQEEASRRIQGLMRDSVEGFRGQARIELAALGEEGGWDFILEKQIEMGASPVTGGQQFEWNIVHYARPQYDLTDELTRRINLRFTQENGAGQPGQVDPIGGRSPSTSSDPE